jgi:hypothetical protein
MRRKAQFLILIAASAALLVCSPASFAQEEAGPRDVDIPNPMAIHTWFIIVAIGAFLFWCISYVLDVQREKLVSKPQRGELLQRKNQLLDRIAELDAQKESGAVAPQRYEKEYRKVRSQLSQVLGRLKRGQDPEDDE